jgi:hypothetical protein
VKDDTSHDHTEFDCIFDRGILDELVSSTCTGIHHQDVGLLLLQATRHIREYGVYIVITRNQLPEETKEYLRAVGAMLGMQWRFDLDGISNETHGTVSVARKYFTGELPTVGKLTTVQHHDRRKPPMP